MTPLYARSFSRIANRDLTVPCFTRALSDSTPFCEVGLSLESTLICTLSLCASSENHCIGGREEFQGLVEGHNDPWVKAIPFYGPRPQQDHTFGHKWFNFTELQRKKLGIEPSEKSYYTAREDIFFPFMTSKVKRGKQGLDLADRPNLHSMTIALRGIVDLFRKADCASDVHRRVLGFSTSHDDRNARIHAHYPEINGEQTTFWRRTVKEINIGDPASTWISHQFTLNTCQTFTPSLLTRLKAVIDRLPDPVVHTSEPVGVDDLSVVSSQDDPSAPESQDDGSGKPRKPGGLQAELRNMVQSLQRQLEHRGEIPSNRGKISRKDSEQQRKDSDQQLIELMQILKQQSEQIKELTRKLQETLVAPLMTHPDPLGLHRTNYLIRFWRARQQIMANPVALMGLILGY